MLVLMRGLDQDIVIGDDIAVKVLGIKDGKVKLGITAPREIKVDRREVRRAKDSKTKDKTHG